MLTEKELEEIRRKMLELDEEPPANGWANIYADIQPKSRWRLFWWLSALLLLITALGGFFAADSRITSPDQSFLMPEKTTEKKVDGPDKKEVDPGNKKADVDKLNPANTTNTRIAQLPVSPDPATDTDGKEFPDKGVIKDSLPDAPPVNSSNRPITIEEKTIQQTPVVAKPENSKKKDPHEEKLRNKKMPGNDPVAINKNFQIIQDDKLIGPAKSREVIPQTNSKTTIIANPEVPGNSGQEEITEITKKTIAPDSTIKTLQPDSTNYASLADTTLPEKTIAVNDSGSIKKLNGWTVGLFFSPRYAFRIFTPSGSDNILITQLNNRNQTNAERMGYELGINVSKAITSTLHLETSLAFMELKENLSYSYTTGKIDTLIRSVSSDRQSVQVTALYVSEERQLISSYAYASWRLGASYYFWQNNLRKFNVTMAGGVNLLVKGKTRQILNGVAQETIHFPSKENILEQTNYNLLIGAGYSRQVLQNYELMLMPTLNYFLGSTFKHREPFGLRPYSLGVHVQLKRRFNQ